MKKWYALRVVSGQENKIVKLVLALKQDDLLSLSVGELHIPTEKVIVERNGKKYTQKRRLLPGYIMIELEFAEEKWKDAVYSLRSIDGVIGFASTVGSDSKPQPLSEEEARSMLQYGKEGMGVKIIRSKETFLIKESVKIIDGPFDGFTGSVATVDDQKSTLRVNVEIFGRITPIDLTFEQVEKI